MLLGNSAYEVRHFKGHFECFNHHKAFLNFTQTQANLVKDLGLPLNKEIVLDYELFQNIAMPADILGNRWSKIGFLLGANHDINKAKLIESNRAYYIYNNDDFPARLELHYTNHYIEPNTLLGRWYMKFILTSEDVTYSPYRTYCHRVGIFLRRIYVKDFRTPYIRANLNFYYN